MMSTQDKSPFSDLFDNSLIETNAAFLNRFAPYASRASCFVDASGMGQLEGSLGWHPALTDLSQEAEDCLSSLAVRSLPSGILARLNRLLQRILLRLYNEPQTVLSVTVEDDDDDLDAVVVVLDRTRRSELRFRLGVEEDCRFSVYRQGVKVAYGNLDLEDALFDSVIGIYRSINS